MSDWTWNGKWTNESAGAFLSELLAGAAGTQIELDAATAAKEAADERLINAMREHGWATNGASRFVDEWRSEMVKAKDREDDEDDASLRRAFS